MTMTEPSSGYQEFQDGYVNSTLALILGQMALGREDAALRVLRTSLACAFDDGVLLARTAGDEHAGRPANPYRETDKA
jgi:hypothetical protein